MDAQTLTAIVEVVLVPVLTFVTMWVRNGFDKDKRQEKREDGFIENLVKDVADLKREVREVRAELKNRDAEYVKLYQDYTTLKARHEVLQSDHDQLKNRYDETVAELTSVKEIIRKDRENTATLASTTAKIMDH